MKTATFNPEKAKIISNQVCVEFDFAMNEVSAFKDTFAKKVVVFILIKYFGYDKRNVGNAYKMTYLYVPTVVNEMDVMLRLVPSFLGKINQILKNIDEA